MDIQSVARDTYAIAAFLMTFDIAALGFSWKKLKAMMNTMPADKRRIRFELSSVSDRNEHLKYEYIVAQFIGCILLAVSFTGALIAFVVMSDIVVIGASGANTLDNFELAIVGVRVGSWVLVFGMFCLAMVYVEDFIAVCRSEPSIVKTELEKLPKREPIGKAQSNILFFSLFTYLIVIGIVVIFVPYNQWVKMAFCIVGGIVIIVVGSFVRKTYRRGRNKEIRR
jgi:hypothetical protein